MKAKGLFDAKKKVPFYSEVNLVVVSAGPSDQTANRDACTVAVRGPYFTAPCAVPGAGAKPPRRICRCEWGCAGKARGQPKSSSLRDKCAPELQGSPYFSMFLVTISW